MGNVKTMEQNITVEVDGLLNAWRSKATSRVLVVASVVLLPVLLAVLSGRFCHFALPVRIVCVLLFLALVSAALRPQWNLKWRASVLLGTLAIASALQLVVTQLSGSGRLSLLALPIFALILLGPRVGWLMVILSIALYTSIVFLGQAELLVLWNVADTDTSLFFWIFQGLRLSSVLLIMMALLTRFHNLQRRTMIAELTALRKLETETADRLRLETEITRVSERERLKLGSELHDGLCQHLTAALLNCTALENKRDKKGSESVTEITGIRESIEESIDMAYDVACGLCLLDMAADALIPALERLCRSVSDRQGISCRIQTDGDVTVDNPEYALHLYRIIAEAVANAVKHAQCSQILIRITQKMTGVMLSVSDNGRGIFETIKDRKGLGRRIMAHRAELMGGALSVSTEPGCGTTVTCRLPDAEGLS